MSNRIRGGAPEVSGSRLETTSLAAGLAVFGSGRRAVDVVSSPGIRRLDAPRISMAFTAHLLSVAPRHVCGLKEIINALVEWVCHTSCHTVRPAPTEVRFGSEEAGAQRKTRGAPEVSALTLRQQHRCRLAVFGLRPSGQLDLSIQVGIQRPDAPKSKVWSMTTLLSLAPRLVSIELLAGPLSCDVLGSALTSSQERPGQNAMHLGRTVVREDVQRGRGALAHWNRPAQCVLFVS